MAYGVKYSCEWTSPMREQRVYTIDILEDGYTGEVYPLYPTGDVLRITQGKIDDPELEPIKSSEAVLSLLCVDEGDPYMSLFTTDPLRYRLRIRQGEGKPSPYWDGYLVAGTYTQDYANPPYHVQLRATDGLAILKDIPYLDANGERFTGTLSLDSIVRDIMARISTKGVIYPYISDNIEPAQAVDTFTVVGLEAEGIYSTLGGSDVPSCYDVLSAILSSMQHQIYQSYSVWCVRPVSSLISARIAKGALPGTNNGGNDIPLYSDADDGVGMSTSSLLSLLPPYKELKTARPDTTEVTEYPSLLVSSRWQPVWGARLSKMQRRDDMLRLAIYNTGALGAAYVFDGIIDKSNVTSLSVALEAYNLAGKEVTFYAGLLLVAADADPIKAWEGNLSDLEVDNVAAWYNEKWVKFSDLADELDVKALNREAVIATMPRFTIEPSSRYVMFEIPVPVKQLSSTSVSLSVANLNSDIAGKYKLVLFLGGNGLPEIELREPTLTVERLTGIEPIERADDFIIHTYGMGDISYDQVFADTWMLPASGTIFESPLIDMRNGSTLRGVVTPGQRQLMSDAAITTISQLRGDICRQLEGDVYTKVNIDVDAKWVDRDGRRYYANYVERLLRRGLYRVQLRELPSAAGPAPKAVYSGEMANIVSMDSSAMWLGMNGRRLYRYDAERDIVEVVQDSPTGTYALTLNEGQCCACVVSYDGVYYTLTAYDTHGEVLSKIEQAQGLIQVYDTVLTDIVMRSARFDANINTWSLVGGDSRATYLQVLSGDGYNISSHSITFPEYCNATDFTLLPNGYAWAGRTNPASNLFTTYWHGFAHHLPGAVEKFADYKRIVACNEVYFLIEDKTKGTFGVYHRTSPAMDYDPTPLYTVNTSRYRFIAMNNALVLFRAIDNTGADTYGAFVYDGRTGNIVTLTTPLAIASTKLWLSRDKVYGAYTNADGSYRITRAIVRGGTGTAAATVNEEALEVMIINE